MAPPTSVLSKTLQSITLTKIRELEKQRNKYEKGKDQVLDETSRKKSKRDVIAHLLEGVKELDPTASKDLTIQNIERWLHQSHYDSSISSSMLDTFENDLRTKLEFQSRKLELADLYSRLLTQWMNPPSTAKAKGTDSEDGFEILERQKERLKDLCDKFESVVFEPLETDAMDIERYLQELFSGEERAKTLKLLREQVKVDGDALLGNKSPFDTESLTWCIKGLLAEDLLSDEKQKILRDFLENELVLKEIADVLNMRFADIQNWDWDAGEEGIPVLPRQGLNGKYRIWMDEDVLQAIFIHYVGIQWCVDLKAALSALVTSTDGFKPALSTFSNSGEVWNWGSSHSAPEAKEKRDYFLKGQTSNSGVNQERKERYTETFFLSQLPSTVHSLYGGGAYDSDEVDEDETDKSKQSSIKQRILRELAAEVTMQRALNGEVAVVQSDLQWYATSLSHTTIFAIMRFVGFSEGWIAFFKKFLEAPLNMAPSSDDTSSAMPRLRKRGVPMAHAPEKLIGELVLFVMDLAVNQETEMTLHRLHDDLWLCGPPEKCAKGWQAMKKFANIAGLEFNLNKTGSVYLSEDKPKDGKILSVLPKGPVCIGFLNLDPGSGEWLIDQSQVEKHVAQLKSQLEDCNSILSWVQTWNSCIGRFFSHTFGEPAFCFGKKHLDGILETHTRIEHALFGHPSDGSQSNVTAHLRGMITSQFGKISIPDAFFYLPEQMGGLGLRNPFIALLLVRDNLRQEPHEIMAKGLADERAQFERAKKNFDAQGKASQRRQFNSVYPRDPPSFDPENFLSWEEFIADRFTTSEPLRKAYIKLTSVPEEKEIKMSSEMRKELRELENGFEDGKGLSEEEKWIMVMYRNELLEGVGGLRLVEQGFLPLGVLTMMRLKKVTWQMVL